MRKLGEILLDLEELLDEAIEEHDLQWGDVLNLVYGHLKIHRPDAQEEYEDGTNPYFYYGPIEDEDEEEPGIVN